MKAIVTGASSGIGRNFAYLLVSRGYTVVAVARRTERLKQLKDELGDKLEIYTADLSDESECFNLYKKYKDEKIDVFINNAGFGIFGKFTETDLKRELKMIKTNVTAVHILTKLFVKKFKQQNSGYILNVASIAGFMAGPLLSSYYASKAYVLRLTEAIKSELKADGCNVSVSVLCPGPVKTEFDSVANVTFSLRGLDSRYVANYALKKMFKGKTVIIPGITVKILKFLSRFAPENILTEITYKCQRKKQGL